MNQSLTLLLTALAAVALGVLAIWLVLPKAVDDFSIPGGREIQTELTKAQNQLKVALAHTNFALSAQALGGAQSHTQHVLNVLVGKDGDLFDNGAFNPGNGVGVINHLGNLQAALQSPELAALIPGYDDLLSALGDAEFSVAEAITATGIAMGFDDLTDAQDELSRALLALELAIGGEGRLSGLGMVQSILDDIDKKISLNRVQPAL
jgi:hypothetical protein